MKRTLPSAPRALLGALIVPLLALLFCSAAPATAQTPRPSLDGVDREQARTRAALCAFADVQGGTYRPFVCEPRCDCFQPVDLGVGAVTTCAETVATEFDLVGTLDLGTCSIDFCEGTDCASSSHLPCSSAAVCEPGEVCSGTILKSCRRPCTTDAECTAGAFCSAASGAACTIDSDCHPDEVCGTSSGLGCTRACNADVDCVLTRTVRLTGVTVADSPAPVTCTDPSLDVSQISSSDALQCLTEYENATGTSCSYICGNQIVQPGEECDDGNLDPGDGCDGSCMLE